MLEPSPNSGTLVLPMMIEPAAFMRSTMMASAAGTKSLKMREPCVVRMPLVAARSLIACGKPCMPAAIMAARQLLVARLGLRNEIAAVLQRRRWR